MRFLGATTGLQMALVRVLLVAPAIVLSIAAWTRLPSALAMERAFPVPGSMSVNVALAEGVYPQAEAILSSANARDGEAHIFQAQAAIIAGKSSSETTAILQSALKDAPGSALAWTLLAEAAAQTDQPRAANSLALAFMLSPFDYYLAPRQVFIAAMLWPVLAEETRALALRRARLLWTDLDLRPVIVQLAQSEAGAQLMTLAFADDPNEMSALIRWVEAERRRVSGPS